MTSTSYISCPICGMDTLRPRGLKTHQHSDNCRNKHLVDQTRKGLEAKGWKPIPDHHAIELERAGIPLRWDLASFEYSRRRWAMEAAFYAPQWAAQAIQQLFRFAIV